MGKINQPHEVRQMDGDRINWKDAPPPDKMCRWTKTDTGGDRIIGTFRTLCHMNRLNNLSRAVFNTQIAIIQPDWNKGVAASAGTHDKDSVWDLFIPGVNWWRQQKFLRANGLWCWYRHAPLFSNHIHGGTLPVPKPDGSHWDDYSDRSIPVGVFVPGQLVDYYNHAFGLSGMHTPGSDRSWFPKNIAATAFDLRAYTKKRAELMRKK
jgi:hypothetical protein